MYHIIFTYGTNIQKVAVAAACSLLLLLHQGTCKPLQYIFNSQHHVIALEGQTKPSLLAV